MALSQEMCLADHNVNWIASESKPEYFYSEEQRIALEGLIDGGTETYEAVLEKFSIKPFLSREEIDRVNDSSREQRDRGSSAARSASAADPAAAAAETESTASTDGDSSLTYWPDQSDDEPPATLDIGWPDAQGYRGVTRATVYTQPPGEGAANVKETVRRLIQNAQSLIAVAMDKFTDMDIFRDILDVMSRRKVAVYIVHDEGNMPFFLSMCERVGMHAGHLKLTTSLPFTINCWVLLLATTRGAREKMRIRSACGASFSTRNGNVINGVLGHKFMIIDGDKAIAGSYSFTWSASRLDRNIITVLTGQIVDTFDTEFRELYATSKPVRTESLKLPDDPNAGQDPEPSPQKPAVAVNATASRRMLNPKYALVLGRGSAAAGGAAENGVAGVDAVDSAAGAAAAAGAAVAAGGAQQKYRERLDRVEQWDVKGEVGGGEDRADSDAADGAKQASAPRERIIRVIYRERPSNGPQCTEDASSQNSAAATAQEWRKSSTSDCIAVAETARKDLPDGVGSNVLKQQQLQRRNSDFIVQQQQQQQQQPPQPLQQQQPGNSEDDDDDDDDDDDEDDDDEGEEDAEDDESVGYEYEDAQEGLPLAEMAAVVAWVPTPAVSRSRSFGGGGRGPGGDDGRIFSAFEGPLDDKAGLVGGMQRSHSTEEPASPLPLDFSTAHDYMEAGDDAGSRRFRQPPAPPQRLRSSPAAALFKDRASHREPPAGALASYRSSLPAGMRQGGADQYRPHQEPYRSPQTYDHHQQHHHQQHHHQQQQHQQHQSYRPNQTLLQHHRNISSPQLSALGGAGRYGGDTQRGQRRGSPGEGGGSGSSAGGSGGSPRIGRSQTAAMPPPRASAAFHTPGSKLQAHRQYT